MERLRMYESRRVVDAALLKMALAILNEVTGFENPTFVTVLKGGLYTSFHMLANIPLPEDTVFGYLGLSSYRNGTKPSGTVEITYDNDLTYELIEGRNIWIVDDICDSGETLDYAKGLIGAWRPKSVKTIVLVDKKANRENHHYPEPDVVGFTYTGDKFLVGAGMGYGEKYRQLRELYELVLGAKNV